MDSDTSKFKIILESPRSRPMDLSPMGLSKKLNCSINTVKSRLENTSLNFSIENSGNYQLYNYECLPILEAYLDAKRFTTNSHEDITSFLERLVNKIKQSPDQTFCKKFLFNQDVFRTYLIQSQLTEPVEQRIRCITQLAQNLAILPAERTRRPFVPETYQSILTYLDKIIYQLSNLTEESESNGILDYEESGPQRKRSVDKIVEDWCSALIADRKSVTNGCEIDLRPYSAGTIEQALNDCLIQNTLTEKELLRASELEKVLFQISEQQRVSHIMSEEEKNSMQSKIRNVMIRNTHQYLETVFKMQPAPEALQHDSCGIGPMLMSIIQDWYHETISITARLERFLHGLILWQEAGSFFGGTSESILYPEQLRAFLFETKNVIRQFWEGMRETDFFDKDADWRDVFETVVQECQISEAYFKTASHSQITVSQLCSACQSPTDEPALNVNQLLITSAVTLEYFWIRYTELYADYILLRCEQYQETLSKTNDQSKKD